TFSSTVASGATPGSLTVTAPIGDVTFGAAVGAGQHQLASLTVTAGRTFLQNVATIGTDGQAYNGQVFLTADAALTSGDGPIIFNGKLDSDTGFGGAARSLTVDAGDGSATFND